MSIALISERTDHFRDFSVWPRQQEFNVEGWLENFRPDEVYIAERLLTSFTYFNKAMTGALLREALQKFLSAGWGKAGFPEPPSQMKVDDICFVQCQGEDPRASDSGNLFARKLRDELRIPDDNIMSPGQALSYADDFQHYIFVDDFVGSGNQLVETLKRCHEGDDPKFDSFKSLLAAGSHTVAYCPCVATSYAQLITIPDHFPSVRLFPAHVLMEHHNATNPASRVWHGLEAEAVEQAILQLRTLSHRAGYLKDDGGQNAWNGFHGLGLTIGFEHGIPDASLPVFFSERNGWKPLMRRSS
jgi:hypothetical protein